jgi:branched-chain amino acid transport system substrate-binding protein
MEGYDGVMVIAEAIKAQNSADPQAIQAGLRDLRWGGTRGTIYFPEDKAPAWKFQQWPEVPIFVIQYDTPNQTPGDAAILWPRAQATVDEILLKP